MDKKWIRLPQGEQKRHEGNWVEVRGDKMSTDWDKCSRTFFLPVARMFPDRGLVKDDREKRPTFVIEGGWMINQFHNVGVKIAGGDPRSLQRAQLQLKDLLEQCLVIEHEGDDNDSET